MVQGLTFVFGAYMLQSLGEAAPDARVWRTTATTVTATADRTAQPGALLYRVDGAVELLGESSPGRGRVFRPALVELPADVGPGARWTTAGTAGQDLTYRSRFRAEAAADGCLLVTGAVAYADTAGRPGETEQHRKLWCPGRGIVEQRIQVGAATQTAVTVPGPPPLVRPTVTAPIRWPDPARWSVRTFQTRSVDPNFGEYSVAGSPTLVPPVVSTAGDHYQVVQQTGDVVGFTPYGPRAWRQAARMHPGGSVLALAAFGDVLVATTSGRQAVGYTADGIRLWTLDLPEIAATRAVRVSDTDAVLADLGGGLRRFDVRTGTVRWLRSVGFDVELAPAVGGGAVVVTDRGGRQTAYAVETGEQRWQAERTADASVFAGPVLVDVDREALEGIDPADGSVRWRRVVDGALNQLAVAGDRAVVATDQASVVVGPDGAEIARLPPYVQLTVTGDYVVGWTRSRGEVWSLDGRRLAEWTPPEVFARALTHPVAERTGVRVPYLTWELDIWSAAS